MQVDMTSMLQTSAAALKAQTTRMRVIAENIANAGTTGTAPGADPYRRQIPVFRDMMDRTLGIRTVRAMPAIKDMSDFITKFDPSHPAANAEGYYKLPNVKPIMETVDMKEAQRSYEANLSVIESTRNLLKQTTDLLRA
jgi:flagellar basal-body rod protein FlgC